MIAVIFEFMPAPGRADRYFELAGQLRAELERIDGFISVERFESLTQPGKFLSLSFWRDEAAVLAWRIAEVVRDYGLKDRTEAPADSRAALR